MGVPHPIPYQGSKRWIAKSLLDCFPKNTATLFEPFAGSAAVSLAAAFYRRAKSFVISDVNGPLIDLWQRIIDAPDELADEYENLWHHQAGKEAEFFGIVRKRFNVSHQPVDFLYLLARCTKAAVRYNRNGEFNNSPDHRRKGSRPQTMRENLRGASSLFASKTRLAACDFRTVLRDAAPADLVYMDPPYQGVCQERDQRYLKGVSFAEFVEALEDLNARNISYIVSYDGRTGDKTHGQPLPKGLSLTHLEVVAGRSTTETLLGRDGITVESIYLSHSLMSRIKTVPHSLLPQQTAPTLFELSA